MNKIFKKIWSESRGCFVVVSETASSISRSKGKVTSLILVIFLTASNVFALTTHNGNVELGTLRDGEKRTLVDSFVINGNATANTPELYISWTSKNFRGMENQSLLVNGNLDSSSPLFAIVHKGDGASKISGSLEVAGNLNLHSGLLRLGSGNSNDGGEVNSSLNVQGTLTIANNDKNRGTFDVLITNLTNLSGISGVLIPVWSEQNGQDDLVWHNATKQDDGSYKVTISASQHKWNSGKYIVHGYMVDASGKNIGLGATSADVVAPKKIGSASRGNYDVLNKIVYLDAGHGGYDPGASYFGISEKSLTLAIQSRVKAKLEAEGYQVVTTRTSDTYVDLTDRSRAANASESDIFVSIHINASGSSAAQGIETYYYQPYAEYPSRINATYHANPTRLSMSDTLANAIQSSLINATGAQNQGVKRQTFAVLRETTAPAVLLELGFLSNPQEAARLNTSAYQETLANAIVAGIKRYYSIYN